MKKVLLIFLLCLFAMQVKADSSPVYISIIIDDLGNRLSLDRAVVGLPGRVTCSILPFTYYSKMIADEAYAAHKEVMVHVPMQAIGGESLGPGGLKLSDTKQQFDQTLMNDLNSIPYVVGLNNHMGSLLTQQSVQMQWLMQLIQPTELYFIDSKTIPNSVAAKMARQYHIPTMSRDVFLDNTQTQQAIDQQFQQLISVARKQGFAIAIGHPYPATIQYLKNELPQLSKDNVILVPVSQLIDEKQYAVLTLSPAKVTR